MHRLSVASRAAAVLLAVISITGVADAKPPKPGLVTAAVVTNGGGLLNPSWETFPAGSHGNAKPSTLDIGAASALAGPAGAALSNDGHVYITNNLSNSVLGFSATAQANTAPEAAILGLDTGLDTPSGIVFDGAGSIVVTNSLGAVCAVTPPDACTTASADLCSLGSITVYPAGSNGDAPPALTIQGCSTALFEPVGVVADVVTVHLFALFGFDGSGNPLYFDFEDFPSNRYWVANLAAGYVSVYLPDFTGGGDAAPAGGFFATTTDNLFLPPVAALLGTTPSTDLSAPDYLAFGVAATEVYITDLTLGFKNQGRIKEFSVFDVGSPATTCIPAFGTTAGFCNVYYTPFDIGLFDTSIEGKKTRLDGPQGILSQASLTPGSDSIVVISTKNDMVLQFAPGASGNVKPEVKIRGGRTQVHQPVGLAIPPAPAPTATPTPAG